MTPAEMQQLFDYNTWANHRSLQAAAALAQEQFTKPLASSFSSVRDTLVHICGAEWVWHERFEGRSPSAIPDFSALQSVDALREHWTVQESKLLAFVRGITQSNLDAVMEYKTINFGVYKNPLWKSMQHVVNHGTYHRGQVTTMLRQLDAKPILTDLMHFYRERAAAVSG
jgi:uncharacterized damage-inducible protein DinB